MKPLSVVAFTIALAGLAGCDRSKPFVPTAPTTPSAPAPVTPTVTGLSVMGTASLAAVGDATQLAAIAKLSDATTKTVTADAAWRSSDPAVIAVSADGLATVVRFGRAFVSATYQTKVAGLAVEATPAGSFLVYGRVREPGNGAVAGAGGVESGSGTAVMTDQNGDYSIGNLTAAAHLSFTKDGFEPIAFGARPGQFDDMPMQRVIRIVAGTPATLTLAPHDMDYAPIADDIHCYPCRMIRVAVADSGLLKLRVTWSDTRVTLGVWVNGQIFNGTAGSSETGADLTVPAGEVLVYVGMTKAADLYVPLTLGTALLK